MERRGLAGKGGFKYFIINSVLYLDYERFYTGIIIQRRGGIWPKSLKLILLYWRGSSNAARAGNRRSRAFLNSTSTPSSIRPLSPVKLTPRRTARPLFKRQARKFDRPGASRHQPATYPPKTGNRAVRALKTKLFSGKQIPFFRLRRSAWRRAGPSAPEGA